MNKVIRIIPIAGFDTLQMKRNILHAHGKQSFGLKESLKDVLKTKQYGVGCEVISPFDIIEEGRITKALQNDSEQNDCNITEKIIIDIIRLLQQHDDKKQLLIINNILDNITQQERIYLSKYCDEINKMDQDQIALSKLYKKYILSESIGYINKYYHKLHINGGSNSEYAKLMISIEKFPLLQEIGSIVHTCNKEIDEIEELEQSMNENTLDLEKNHLKLHDYSQRKLQRLSFKSHLDERFIINIKKFVFDLQSSILQSDEYDAKYFIDYYKALIDIKRVVDVLNNMSIKE